MPCTSSTTPAFRQPKQRAQPESQPQLQPALPAAAACMRTGLLALEATAMRLALCRPAESRPSPVTACAAAAAAQGAVAQLVHGAMKVEEEPEAEDKQRPHTWGCLDLC
jgi:hypothetical protein